MVAGPAPQGQVDEDQEQEQGLRDPRLRRVARHQPAPEHPDALQPR